MRRRMRRTSCRRCGTRWFELRHRNSHTFNTERARAAARRRWHPTPLDSQLEGGPQPAPERDGPGASPHRSPTRSGDSGTTAFPADWTVEDARRALRDEGTPAYVQQRIREWLHTKEQEMLARSEPEELPRPGGVNLTDVLALAAASGMDLDALVAAAKAARAPTVESS
jgi:hypothetical protein